MRYLFVFLLFFSLESFAQQHSVARKWNEVLLEAIRNDFARPTVHARNLFHASVCMYDAWAIVDPVAETYFLGKTVNGYPCPFNGIPTPIDNQAAQEEAMSFAMYRLLNHRFSNSPGANETLFLVDSLMISLGYDTSFVSVLYEGGSFAALGNYLAENIIAYGLQDGSNEIIDYENLYYTPINDELIPISSGNPNMTDPNRWQPLSLEIFIDQAGNISPTNTPSFLSPEWGSVAAFALDESDLDIYERNGDEYWVYHDPGVPPELTESSSENADLYKWGFELVSIWGSHLTSDDTTRWDISPASIGNIQSYPESFSEHQQFYDLYNGGDTSPGHSVNPSTGLPYVPQMVKRGDYARILAEFWADGPDSETPPGHWYTILNYVNDHPELNKQFEGSGNVLNDLEWDVKSYFALGGAVHDAAVAAWGVKGWYDYVRPISALRYMAEKGQSSDSTQFNYHPEGLQLQEGFVELIQVGDDLAGSWNQFVGEIKVLTWRGHEYITDPDTDVAGVGWILAKDWWPYQRPSFVTPPFAGYVSGHSTFSRSAAELLTAFTGDAFFPGGIGEFEAPMNEFLVFEDGPSEDVTLQWATYRDASDQCSLSRIWGGIHPPADDIPGRLMGIEIGNDAFALAKQYFEGNPLITHVDERNLSKILVYPNPVSQNIVNIVISGLEGAVLIELFDMKGRLVRSRSTSHDAGDVVSLDVNGLSDGLYAIRCSTTKELRSGRVSILR